MPDMPNNMCPNYYMIVLSTEAGYNSHCGHPTKTKLAYNKHALLDTPDAISSLGK